MDNSAIARIAAPDLTSEALALLDTHGANDDVVFFLGRLVWQGEMVDCARALAKIACDPARGRYARVAAIRGVMAVGDEAQKAGVWETITSQSGPLDHAVLAELLDGAAPTTASVGLLLRALEHAAPFEHFNVNRIDYSLHTFIDRLPVMTDWAGEHPLGCLVEGLSGFLAREPFIARGECHVSQEFAWLMSPALHAVDRLVAARSSQALTPAAVAVMLNMPALQSWQGGDLREFKSALSENVPRWHELNDHLYWTSIAHVRARLEPKGRPLVGDWPVAFMGHFWNFGPEDFGRCLDWVNTKEGDDQLVALGRCLQLFVDAERPVAWLQQLHAAVDGDEKLEAILEGWLNPRPSPEALEMDAERRRWKRTRERRERTEKKNRAVWVQALKADPDQILHPTGLEPGAFSHDHLHLLTSCMSSGPATSRDDGANWQSLIPEFGEPVARAYRDAAVAHWRVYRPELRSEGADTRSTPYSLIFAMTGLVIEAAEDDAFFERLTPDEARLAFRYITWELNGFPAWFERLYRAFPEIGLEAVTTELAWELEHSGADHSLHYILHDIFYHAPWLHAEVSPTILDWLRANEMPNIDGLRYCLNIMIGGDTPQDALATLARGRVQNTVIADQRPRWFALWVDVEPGAAIPALEAALETLPPNDASEFAQRFVVELLGDRRGTGKRVWAYRNARDLKALYILMHRFIRIAEDIERADKGVYSPTLRDNAQTARGTLFDMLAAEPGAEAYAAIKALEAEHPEPSYRRWMAVKAHQRATIDGDEPAWTAEQVRDFVQGIVGV